jgi:hypothetical protein
LELLRYRLREASLRKGAQMGKREVRFSDLTGEDIPEDQLARLIVRDHPTVRHVVTLDVSSADVEGLKQLDQVVRLEYFAPGEDRPTTMLVQLADFEALAKDREMGTILEEASSDQTAAVPAKPGRGRPRKSGDGAALARRGKVNYATIEHAGEPHRGRITDAEKELVRNNLETINDRLRGTGKREIDPNDPEMKNRYGL